MYIPMAQQKRRGFLFSLVVLFLLNILVFCFIFLDTNELQVTFLNVGQGDAIFIESPTGAQMLIDGGRDRSVLRELGKRMSPLDRTIDIVVATHPDADHIGGLSGVFSNYKVSKYITPDIDSETNTAEELAFRAGNEKGVEVLTARRGMKIDMGGGAYADILFPDRDVSGVETNTGSVIMRVVYGETEFLLSGDAPLSIENWLVTLDGERLESDVLKAGHHGSRTSTGDAWLGVVRPKFVVISAGKDNSYGHPHQEVVDKVLATGATLLSTVDGAVRFTSNGTTLKKK
jgi:competence protein ComEC